MPTITNKKTATKTAASKTKKVAVPAKKTAVKAEKTKSADKKSVATKKPKVARVPVAPLVIEPYPRDYTGLPFLTLIQFRKQPMLVIVDNADSDAIRAYVLDLCGPQQVNEEKIVLAAAEWFMTNKSNFPVSIEFARRGLTSEASKIYRTFDVEFVSRIIGPVPEFPMGAVKSVKRRRRKAVPPGVDVVNLAKLEEFFSS